MTIDPLQHPEREARPRNPLLGEVDDDPQLYAGCRAATYRLYTFYLE